jgi:uncharacterized protein YdaT
MPWNQNDYPASLKNLEEGTRNKAIEIANALLEEGYEAGRAISIAISQAKKWAEGSLVGQRERTLHVVPHPAGWAVRRVGAQRASFVFDTHDEARDKALEMAKEEGAKVVLHGKNGEIKKHIEVPA